MSNNPKTRNWLIFTFCRYVFSTLSTLSGLNDLGVVLSLKAEGQFSSIRTAWAFDTQLCYTWRNETAF